MNDPTKEEIAQIRYVLVKTAEQMGTMFDISDQTWLNWESGKSTPLPVFRKRLIKLRDFLIWSNSIRQSKHDTA